MNSLKKSTIRALDSNQKKTQMSLKKTMGKPTNFNEQISSSKRSTAKIIKKSVFHPENEVKIYNCDELNNDEINIYNIERQVSDKILDQRRVIKKIDTNLFCTYFCFCFIRKRQNFGNALLDEAMGIITNKLDIYNMFRNLYFIDEIKKNNNYKYNDIVMSDECKNRLKEVSHKIVDSFYRL